MLWYSASSAALYLSRITWRWILRVGVIWPLAIVKASVATTKRRTRSLGDKVKFTRLTAAPIALVKSGSAATAVRSGVA